MLPPSTAVHRISRRDRSSSSTAGRKRSSSCTGAPLPPSKRPCSSSLTKGGTRKLNRIHRRVVVCDYGKPIYKASSRVAMLDGLIDCIEGCESLYTKVGMLQRDISMNNLIINGDDLNPSWRSFLIDLDLAIKEQRAKPSGAQGKTGTRAFMAIGCFMVSNIPLCTTLNHFSECFSGSAFTTEDPTRAGYCLSLTSGIMPIQKNWLVRRRE